MSTDDGQKRQRVSKACDNCRRRKVRCDGTQPICSNCNAIGIACTYNDTTKKRGPPKGYIEAIESRLHRMEHILGDLVQGEPGAADNVVAELCKLDENHITSSHKSPNHSQIRTKSSESNRNSKEDITDSQLEQSSSSGSYCTSPKEIYSVDLNSSESGEVLRREDHELEELSNEAEQLTLDDHGRVRYCGTSSGFYLLRQTDRYQKGVLKMRSRSPERINLTSFRDSEFNPSLLPSSHLFSYLLEVYFNTVNPIFPLLHKAEFLERLRNVNAEPPFFLLNSILALSAILISSEDVLKKENLTSEIFYQRSRVLLDRTYEMSSLENIQALILLSIYQHVTHSGMKAWLYSGMAIRMAEDLGLHRNPEKWDIEGLTQQEKEARKRVWWVCYQIDRHASVCVGRPLCIDDRHYDTTLPFIDLGNEAEAGVGVSLYSGLSLRPFIQVIRLKEIIGRIMSEIYPIRTVPSHNPQKNKSILLELDSALHSWLVSLPEGLQYSPNDYSSNEPPNSPTLIYAHIWYHCGLILLHRPYIPKPGENYRFPYPSLPICTTAANRTTMIALACLNVPTLEQAVIFLLFPIFTSSTIHLLNATSNDPWIANPAKEYLSKNLEIFERTRHKWGHVGRYEILLRELIAARNILLKPEIIDKEASSAKGMDQGTGISTSRPPGKECIKQEPDFNAVISPIQQSYRYPKFKSNFTEINPYTPTQWYQSSLLQSVERPVESNFEMTSDPYAMVGAVPSPVFNQNVSEISSENQGTLEQYVNPEIGSTWDVPMSVDFDEWNEYVGQYMVDSSIAANGNSNRSADSPSVSLRPMESSLYTGSINSHGQPQVSKYSIQHQQSSVLTSPSTSTNTSPYIGSSLMGNKPYYMDNHCVSGRVVHEDQSSIRFT